MHKLYDITHNGHTVGKASINKEGLYYSISCDCTFADNNLHRLCWSHGNGQTDLGVFVPENNTFVIRKKLSCKKIAEDNWKFMIASTSDPEGLIQWISEDFPITCLTELQNACLIRGQNRVGIILK